MNNTPQYAWDSISDYYDIKIKGKYYGVKFNSPKRDEFIEYFRTEYNNIMNDYMKNNVHTLDRHKQTAILISDIIQNEIIYSEYTEKNQIFIGTEQVALLFGLSFMRNKLNEILRQKKLTEIERYIFPEPMSCKTPYFDVLTRDLYFQKHKNNSVYILFLAHILFQIEYWTLKENGIDPKKLKEWLTLRKSIIF